MSDADWEERIRSAFDAHPGSWRPDPENWFREGWLAGYEAERDAARADLAATNARIAELEKPRVHSLSENERLILLRADNAALRERIDNALALADMGDRMHGKVNTSDLRAALAADTPTTATAAEGSDQ